MTKRTRVFFLLHLAVASILFWTGCFVNGHGGDSVNGPGGPGVVINKPDPKLRERVQELERLYSQQAKNRTGKNVNPDAEFTSALQTWALNYGYSLEDAKKELDIWAKSVDQNRQASTRDRALAALAKRDFSHAAQIYDKSTEEAVAQLEQFRKGSLLEEKRQFANITSSSLSAGDAWLINNDPLSALHSYDAAQIVPKDYDPITWALLQAAKGIAHHQAAEKVQGTQVPEHLRLAVESYRNALTQLTTKEKPLAWAMVQNNLAITLQDQSFYVSGPEVVCLLRESSDILRKVILTSNGPDMRDVAVRAQQSLGNALMAQARYSGPAEACELLDQAVTAFTNALAVFKPATAPEQWAASQHSLGIAFTEKSKCPGANAPLFQDAADVALHSAVDMFLKLGNSNDCARAQNDLGTLLLEKAPLDPQHAKVLTHQAVEAYKNALTTFTRTNAPLLWARTKLVLGAALTEESHYNTNAAILLLHDAVAAERDALNVFTFPAMVQEWAMTKNNLGSALCYLAQYNTEPQRLLLLHEGLTHFEDALRGMQDPAFQELRKTVESCIREAKSQIQKIEVRH